MGPTNDDRPVKPVAFMVMPFGQKQPEHDGERIPDVVDFDVLWEDVFRPVLAEDYTPIRADEDWGTIIITQMIERLTAADLVVADVTLANANVYWEIGVRHAARRTGCVLVAADWAQVPFDLAQIRRIPYPLPSGNPTDADKAAIRSTLSGELDAMAGGETPVFAAVPGFPDPDVSTLSAFQEYAREMEEFHSRVVAIRTGDGDRRSETEELVRIYPAATVRSKGVAWEIIKLVRDHVDWESMLAYLDALPSSLRNDPGLDEQRFLAIAKSGDPAAAIPQLEKLIGRLGQTGERCGILGGRYKQRWRTEAESRPGSPKAEQFLRKAIEAYEEGMYADLNEYYCASNLPRLYRSLAQILEDAAGDPAGPEATDLAAKAERATAITLAACHRALEFGRGDEWLRPTMLTMAFEAGKESEVRNLVRQISAEDPADWKLATTIADLRTALAMHSPEQQAKLGAQVEELEGLLAE
jgi:hypothetical protein